jgi:putative membrane protein
MRVAGTAKGESKGHMETDANIRADFPRQDAKLDRSTELALMRTRAAYERTMMSWIRTATSLITFGFSIYKFFQLEGLTHAPQNHIIGPRQFALLLVSIGLISLLLATLEHRRYIRALEAEYAGQQRSLAVLVAALISILGIVAFIAMVFRQ